MLQIPIICSTLDVKYILNLGVIHRGVSNRRWSCFYWFHDVGEDRLTQISEALTKRTSFVQTTRRPDSTAVQFSQISDDHVGIWLRFLK